MGLQLWIILISVFFSLLALFAFYLLLILWMDSRLVRFLNLRIDNLGLKRFGRILFMTFMLTIFIMGLPVALSIKGPWMKSQFTAKSR